MKNIFSKDFWDARDVELYIGKLLRYGVMLSCIITLIGGVLYFYQNQSTDVKIKYAPIEGKEDFGTALELREFSSIWEGVLSLNGAAIIQLGVIVLIATPILRVSFSVFAFLIEKDYMYVVITLIVLFIILANMLLGLH
ncbi:MAG: DUF1634 domain-containing protein [Dysgonomonas sp.]